MPAPPPIPRELEAPVLRPNFLGSLLGLWAFTWKTRVSLRRLPVQILLLLVLPALICLTVRPSRHWSMGEPLVGDASADYGDFINRLSRGRMQLRPDQIAEVMRVFNEEYAKADLELGDPQAGDATAARQQELMRDCYRRIGARLEKVLDDGQFMRFQRFQREQLVKKERLANQPRWGRTSPFYHWLIDFYFFIILPLACVGSCGALIREELQSDTLNFLTTRPITRARLVVAKFIAQTAWLQIIAVVQVLLLVAAGAIRQVPNVSSLLPLLIGTQILAVFAWSALGTFLGLVTKKYMAISLLYGFIVELGIGRIPTNINTLSLMRHLKSLLSHNPALQAIYDWPAKGVPLSISALLVAMVIFVGLAALLFTYNEYHHTAEMQK